MSHEGRLTDRPFIAGERPGLTDVRSGFPCGGNGRVAVPGFADDLDVLLGFEKGDESHSDDGVVAGDK